MESRRLSTTLVLCFIFMHVTVYGDVENVTEIVSDNRLDNEILANRSAPCNWTNCRDLDRPFSTAFDHLFHEIKLMNKHLSDVKSLVGRLKLDIKEEIDGMVDDLNGLKVAIGEAELDLQSTRNSMESIHDWTTSADGKFVELEKSLKSSCHHNYPIAQGGHQNNKRKQHKHQKEGKKLKSIKMKETDKDLQADSSANMAAVNQDGRGNCCSDIRLELQNLQLHCSDQNRRPSSCADVMYQHGSRKLKNGPHPINPAIYGFDAYLNVFCDFETDGGGWTVLQRRDDFGLPKENFERNWTEYKTGFGDVSRELWLGNDAIYALTNQEPVELRIELENFGGEVKYAQYSLFRLGSEKDHYRIFLGKYNGDAADSLGRSRGMAFSTKDYDNDKWTGNCAQRFRGGWWFNNCHDANLNGHYYGGEHESYADGVNWYHWTGFHYSLKRTEMKIRPVWFAQMQRRSTD